MAPRKPLDNSDSTNTNDSASVHPPRNLVEPVFSQSIPTEGPTIEAPRAIAVYREEKSHTSAGENSWVLCDTD